MLPPGQEKLYLSFLRIINIIYLGASLQSHGARRNVPPPPHSEKLLLKTGVIFQEYILSERRQELQEIVKICEKSQFSIEILIKKSQSFHEIFQIFFVFGSTAQNFAAGFLTFTCQIEIIRQISIIFSFLQIPVDFLQNFHPISKSSI